ncbi:hypothetical protein EYF80_018455 [Liparis tanakae]|uniref:Uncharacterized protein n=1 Tax=Liparis tanakae TaxID=230148 RepID=A0A4Z2I090_9TELE|nr:hypothetical protein EYF80_018455 [Liparis tanakae]
MAKGIGARKEAQVKGRLSIKGNERQGSGKVRSKKGTVGNDLKAGRQTERGLGGCSVAGGEAPGLVAGPSPCDLQEAEGHRLTPHRHRKRALAQERNTIQRFHKATARLGARVLALTKYFPIQSRHLYTPDFWSRNSSLTVTLLTRRQLLIFSELQPKRPEHLGSYIGCFGRAKAAQPFTLNPKPHS